MPLWSGIDFSAFSSRNFVGQYQLWIPESVSCPLKKKKKKNTITKNSDCTVSLTLMNL